MKKLFHHAAILLFAALAAPLAHAWTDTPAPAVHGDSGDDGRSTSSTFQGLATDSAPDARGAFSSSVPLQVPPFHGLEPKLTVSYSSAAGDGNAGQGWSVNAGMMVQRVSPGRGLPTWDDTKDFYLLNGGEYHPCSTLPQNVVSPGCSNPAGPGQYVYYYSKIERYQRLAYDPTNQVWILWNKSGTRYDFKQPWVTPAGNAFAWLLTTVTDTSSNAVQYFYAADTTTNAPPSADCYWLSAIVYNGTLITFWPEARNDSVSGGMGDSALSVQRNRLKTIDIQTSVAGGNQRVRTYQLQYQPSPTGGASLLTQLREFGTDTLLDGAGNISNPNTATSLPPLALGYASQQAGGGAGGTGAPWGSSINSAAQPAPATAPDDAAGGAFWQDFDASGFQHVTLDLNGDGLPDHLIVYAGGHLPGSDSLNAKHAMTTRILIFIAQSDGSYTELTPFDTGLENFWGKDRIFVGDLDGNHTDELIIAHYSYGAQVMNNGTLWPVDSATIVVRTYFFDRSFQGFVSGNAAGINWPVAELQPVNPGTVVPTLDADHIMVADVNGDGLADLVRAQVVYQQTQDALGADYGNCAFASNPVSYVFQTALGRGDGSFVATDDQPAPSWVPTINEAYYPGDPDGDAVCMLDNRPVELGHWMTGDFNGDGRADLMYIGGHAAGIQNDPESGSDHWYICTALSSTNDPALFNIAPYTLSCAHDHMGYYYGDWFFSGDANGDGRTDILRVSKDPASGNSNAFAYLSTIDAGLSWPPAAANPTTIPWVWDWGTAVVADNSIDWVNGHAFWSAADVDGDGRTDLMSFHYAPGGDVNETTLYTISPKATIGTSQVTFTGTMRTVVTPPWGTFEQGDAFFPGFEVADRDGDARADVVLWKLNAAVYDDVDSPSCAPQPNPGGCYQTNFSPYVIHSAPTVDDVKSWREADLDGDGRPDLVRVSARSPGIVVETRLRNADGSFSPGPTDGASYWGAQLTGARAGSFIVADFNGDGRADITYPKYRSDLNTVELLTLDSQPGGGYLPVDSTFTVTVPMDDVAGWFAADLNGDGKVDLVHLSYTLGDGNGCASQHQLQLDSFISSGPSSFFHSTQVSNTCGVPEQLRAWHVLDLNHDGKADLAAVWRDPGGGGLIAYSLISDGVGDYSVRSSSVAAADRYRGRWMPMDLNGDGLADLVAVDTIPDAGVFDVEVTGLIALGDGTWQATTETAWPFFYAPDATAWRPADLNGDGHADLVHTNFNNGTVSLDELRTSPQSGQRDFLLSPSLGFASFSGSLTPEPWHALDVNGDGQAELEHLSFNHQFNELEVELASPPPAPDLLTSIDNGIGGVKNVAYGSALAQTQVNDPAAGCRLPPGRPPLPVSSITLTSFGTAFESESYGFTCPVWSPVEQRMWGWQRSQTSEGPQLLDRPPAVEHRYYQITDACGPQLLHDDRMNPVTQEGRYSNRQYVTAGAAPPYHCELANRSDGEADINLHFAETKSEYSYTPNGDLEWLNEDGDPNVNGDERTTHRSYAMNSSLYIDTIYQERVYAGYGDAGTKVRDAEYCYDGQNPDIGPCGHTAINRGLRTAVVDWNDQLNVYYTTKRDYDAFGNTTKITDANLHATVTAYDPSFHVYATSVTNALSQLTSTSWSYVLGKPLTVTDANNLVATTNVYDALGRLRSATAADGGQTRYEYNLYGTSGQNQTVRRMDGTQDGVWTRVVFDGLGRTVQTVSKGDGLVAAALSSENVYGDGSTRPWKTTHLHDASQGATATEVMAYDYANRQVGITHGDGNSSSVSFFVRQRHEVDERLDTRNVYADAYGRMTTSEELFTDQNGVLVTKDTQYGYDTLGRMNLILDAAGNTSVFVTDSLGRKLSSSDPDSGFTRFTYDAAGNLLTQTDARNVTLTYTYDALDRRKTKSDSLNGRVVTWGYDENGHTYPIGRLTSLHDSADGGCPSGTQTFGYDNTGRVINEYRCVDGIPYTTVSHFDGLGRLLTLQYPDNETVTYGYDPAGRLSSVSNYVNLMKYDTGARLSSVTLKNNVIESFSYHAQRDWLLNVSMTANGGSYSGLYTYWPDSLVKTSRQTATNISAIVNGVNVNSITDNLGYTYDQLHRLKSVAGSAPETFTYDALGNVLSSTTLGSRTYGPSWHACGTSQCGGGPHAMLSGGNRTYQYDIAGDMLSSTVTSTTGNWQRLFTWDEERRPTAISLIGVSSGMPLTTNVTYGGDGERVKKIAPDGTTTRYFGPLVERSSAGHLIKYIYAGARLVATRDSITNTATYYHQDRLGSTRFLTTSTGAPIANTNYYYSAFGSLTRGSTTPADSVAYTGQRQDAETAGFDADGGLVYLHARYYDPYISRFISADDVIPEISNPQSLNRYSYVTNNPISNVDPTGHDGEDVSEGASDIGAEFAAGAAQGAVEEPSCGGGPEPNMTPGPVATAPEFFPGGYSSQDFSPWVDPPFVPPPPYQPLTTSPPPLPYIFLSRPSSGLLSTMPGSAKVVVLPMPMPFFLKWALDHEPQYPGVTAGVGLSASALARYNDVNLLNMGTVGVSEQLFTNGPNGAPSMSQFINVTDPNQSNGLNLGGALSLSLGSGYGSFGGPMVNTYFGLGPVQLTHFRTPEPSAESNWSGWQLSVGKGAPVSAGREVINSYKYWGDHD